MRCILKLVFIFSLIHLFLSDYALSNSSHLFKGAVVDSISGEGLPFASLQLIALDNEDFKRSGITDINGHFSIDNLVKGKYRVNIAFMGYLPASRIIEIKENDLELIIALTKKSISLKGVNIVEQRQYIEQRIEKTTINVSGDESAVGGTALDLMQSLPSVDVDINGQIRYRGSDRVNVLINGQKSSLVTSLDQIPADRIDRIELISNPAAKFEAEGMSGIINIVLKVKPKDQKKTTLRVYAGYPKTYGLSSGFSMKRNKSFFNIGGSYQHKTKFQTKEHWRTNENELASDYYQYDRMDELLNTLMLNGHFRYELSKNQQIGISIVGSRKFNEAGRNIRYTTLKNEIIEFDADKDIEISLDNCSIDSDIDHQYLFNKNGRVLKTNMHYSVLDQIRQMENIYYPNFSIQNQEMQNTRSYQLNKMASFSSDYIHPINDSLIVEAGYRFNQKDLLNDFTSSSYNKIIDDWEKDSALANNFHYLQNIHALYASASLSVEKFKFRTGLRAEYTLKSQSNREANESFDFFPSFLVTHQSSKSTQTYLSYNRRINRPTIKMLNPYSYEYADILNMHIGNPDLNPEFVNSIELGSRMTKEKSTLSTSVYFRNINHAISRVKSAGNDSALFVTFMNLDGARLYGGELSYFFKAFKWWQLRLNSNVFYTKLSGEYGPNLIEQSRVAWNLNIMNQFKLPAGIGFQLNGYYRSKLPDVMGTYMERYYIDLALSKKVLKDKGKIVFKVSDVFNTYRYGLDLYGIDESGFGYTQVNRRKNESQYFILSFMYNIQSKEAKKKKTNYYLEGFGK